MDRKEIDLLIFREKLNFKFNFINILTVFINPTLSYIPQILPLTKMVNTFLVDVDFYNSARKLDYRRLGKQRVEAEQIHSGIVQLRLMAQIAGIPDFPVGTNTSIKERQDWVNAVLEAFQRNCVKSLLIPNGVNLLPIQNGRYTFPATPIKMVPFYRKGSQPAQPAQPARVAFGNKLIQINSNEVIEVRGKREKIVSQGKLSDYLSPNDILLTTGFKRHPALIMWLGFETALQAYINAHIRAWVERGYKNTMQGYDGNLECFARPLWTLDPKVIDNYKAALIVKEITREEDAWYVLQDDFVDAWISKDTILSVAPLADINIEVNRKKFKELIYKIYTAQPNTKEWYDYYTPEDLLSFGHFPGYIWQ